MELLFQHSIRIVGKPAVVAGMAGKNAVLFYLDPETNHVVQNDLVKTVGG